MTNSLPMKVIKIKFPNKTTFARCLVDDDNYEEMKKVKWHLIKDGYAANVKYLFRRDGKDVMQTNLMHRLILNAPDYKASSLQVDHVNGDKLDNRKKNLRFCTNSENKMNQMKHKDNSLGVKGVSRNKKRFAARVQANKKGYYLGTYDSIDEASRAYKAKAKELHREFFHP